MRSYRRERDREKSSPSPILMQLLALPNPHAQTPRTRHTFALARTNARTNAQTRARAHRHTHTDTHTDWQSRSWPSSRTVMACLATSTERSCTCHSSRSHSSTRVLSRVCLSPVLLLSSLPLSLASPRACTRPAPSAAPLTRTTPSRLPFSLALFFSLTLPPSFPSSLHTLSFSLSSFIRLCLSLSLPQSLLPAQSLFVGCRDNSCR